MPIARRSPSLPERVLAAARALRGSVLDHPFGDEVDVLKAGGRIFAVVSVDGPPRITLKIDPEHGRALVASHPAVGPGYHMDKRHWISVDPAAPIDVVLVLQLLEDSYDLVVAGLPAGRRRALLESP